MAVSGSAPAPSRRTRGGIASPLRDRRMVRTSPSTRLLHLRDRRARPRVTMRLELGDARIRMEAVRRDRPEERYDVILGSLQLGRHPVHLLTARPPPLLRLAGTARHPRASTSRTATWLEPVGGRAGRGRDATARMVEHGDTGDIRGGVERAGDPGPGPEDFAGWRPTPLGAAHLGPGAGRLRLDRRLPQLLSSSSGDAPACARRGSPAPRCSGRAHDPRRWAAAPQR